MSFTKIHSWCASACALLLIGAAPLACLADNTWEVTPEGRQALNRGLEWLNRNQSDDGSWSSKNLGLVSLGLLAFLSDGHSPGHGHFGMTEKHALNFVLHSGRPSGLLNISGRHHDMYNHGLSTFVLGQAYGMTDDARVGPALDKALKVIIQSQCRDGGWRYESFPDPQSKDFGNDLSLAVMQAKALRSAVDSGFEIPPSVVRQAIRDVRDHYTPHGCPRDASEEILKQHTGRFTYNKGGDIKDIAALASEGDLNQQRTLVSKAVAMAAAGVVCLQEFGQYDDWRIAKNIEDIEAAVHVMSDKWDKKAAPFDAYTLYYVAQALYQVGGEPWKRCYPLLRDRLITSQINDKNNPSDGGWQSVGWLSDKEGTLYQTSVGCFVLAIPNRYLPILQEGKIDSLKAQFDKK